MTRVDDALETLEVRISRAHAGGYAVELRLGEREFPGGVLGPEILNVGELGPADEGTRLFTTLTAASALRSAWDQAGVLQPRRRIRLRIDDSAPDLHPLAWEAMQDPTPAAAVRFIAADGDTPFSRHAPSAFAPLGPLAGPLRILTAVAAPSDHADYGLAPVDRAAERALLAEVLAAAPDGVVRHTALEGPCSLAALAAELERGYDVLHVVAHGTVTSDRSGSVMFLEGADGKVERVDAARFARALDCIGRSLRLVVLISCNTATRNPADPRSGFAPALLAAGVPAVLAMQDPVPMPTAAAFTRAFYEEVWRSGELDRAANRARRLIFAERLRGSVVPALYATGPGLRLLPARSANEVSAPASVNVQTPASETAAPVAAAPAAAPQPGAAAASAAVEQDLRWEAFGGPLRALAVVVGGDGCVHAFGIDDDHALGHRRELAPGGAWSEWEALEEGTVCYAVSTDPRGRIAVVSADEEGAVRLRLADAAGVWAGGSELTSELGPVDLIGVAHRTDGSLMVVAQAEDRTLVVEQRGVNGRWGEWYDVGDGSDDLFALRNGVGDLVLIGLAAEDLWYSAQRRPDSDWAEWKKLAVGIVEGVAVCGPRGCLNLFAIDNENRLKWSFEERPGGAWSDFVELAPDCCRVAAAFRGDGSLGLFVVEPGTGVVWLATMAAGESTAWRSLGGRRIEGLQAVTTPRGSIALFAVDAAGQVSRLVGAP